MGRHQCVIYGGSGFIGRRLAARLLKAGHRVRLADKQPPPEHADLWVPCDVRDARATREAAAGMDTIYNLAAEHGDDVWPLRLYKEANVAGAHHVCAAADAHGIQRYIYISSVAVYGFSPREVDEDTEPRPFNEYGRTKLEAERICDAWFKAQAGRCLVIVRPTVVFGEGNRGNVYTLVRQIASGRFVMVGNGANRKSMAYVENVAAFLEFLLDQPPGRGLYNYADKPDFDMNGLVSEVRAKLGLGPTRLRVPYALGCLTGLAFDLLAFVTRLRFPISLIRVRKFCANTQFSVRRAMEAGFRPPVPLEQGLARMLEAEFGAQAGRRPNHDLTAPAAPRTTPTSTEDPAGSPPRADTPAARRSG